MWLCLLAIVLLVEAARAEEKLPWWRSGVFYQVYPRSFKDSDGNGLGDLKGIAQKASHFSEIGVDAIWLNPIFKSPMVDCGYDVSDYTTIEPLYGTMDDFKELSARLKELDIKLVLDFVPNHTSDQHIWFQASSNPSHPLHQYYKDFYVWKPANGTTTDGKPIPPNNWMSIMSGSMWEWCEKRNMFYLHQFLIPQPDLNFRNPNVISNLTALINFWLDQGVDGFRMDAVKFLYEHASFANQPPIPGTDGSTFETQQHLYDTNQPENIEVLDYWTDVIHDRVLRDGRTRAVFCEVYDPTDLIMQFYGSGNRTMRLTFNFNFVDGNSFSQAADLKHFIDDWLDNMPSGAVPNWVVGNHDNSRVSRRFGADMMDAINLLTGVLPGVKCVYYGEEIGMDDTFVLWNQTMDSMAMLLGPEHYHEITRDPQRTPMQWDSSTSSGFSLNKTTWLPVNPNYWWLNVAAQKEAPVSHLKVFRDMNRVRQDPVLQRGDLKTIVSDPNTLLVIRSYLGSYYVLVINMGSYITTYTSQNLFGLHGVDMDMTVAVASINSGYSPGTYLKGGFLSVTLRPKAAILLRSTSTSVVTSSTPSTTSGQTSGSQALTSTVLLLCVFIASLHLRLLSILL